MHDYARRLALATSPGAAGAGGPMGVAAVTSVDAMFKRKRGRPPKNRIIEVGRGRSRAPRRPSEAQGRRWELRRKLPLNALKGS